MGQLSPKAFETLLAENGKLEHILKMEAPIPPFSTSSAYNLYQYLIELDYSKLQHILNAQDAMTAFVKRRDESFSGNSELQTWMKHLSRSLPKWLTIDAGYLDTLRRESIGLIGQKLENWLKREIIVRFKSVSKPPKWLQSPSWPVEHGVPLIFLGQVSAGAYFHDETAVYVFLNPKTGNILTITQSA
jgi:hypothetical protein